MMKQKICIGIAVLCLLGQTLFAADTNAVITDLNDLVGRINLKLSQGANTESNLADNLKEFDTLLAKHKTDPDHTADRILLMKAQLYLQVLNDAEKGSDILKQLKRDFPETKLNVDEMITALAPAIEKQKIRNKLVEGTQFPDFKEQDLFGNPISISALKGKVVLVDFWATWCPPCRAELPYVLQTYKKYHDQGFEIIGVSLDEDRSQLKRFLTASDMTWPQFFDGQKWENKLAVKYGVDVAPTTYLLGRDGKIIARNLRGEELSDAVAKALAK